MKPFKQTNINPPVFFSAAALILLLVGLAAFAPGFTQQLFSDTQTWILSHVSWFYILTVAIILLSTFFLAISRYGDIKLGPVDILAHPKEGDSYGAKQGRPPV
ncbi:MAG: hypothetical protein GX070_12985 [Alcaligenaceae bacterium]|nr:hypothetical protein [Alcaligenaceae bacterium]